MDVSSYRDLKVWQLAIQLSEMVYEVTDGFPSKEMYGLSSQIRRAAVSVPSNIAEGHARNSTKEFLRFVSIAMGSLAELDTQLELSRRLKYVSETSFSEITERTAEVGRMLRGLQRALSHKLAPSP
jgi:four helix bundle protein